MITDKYYFIEGKGKDRIPVPNYRHLILSSNEDWPVHLDPDDRRFFVLRVSEACKENHLYFKAIQEQLNNDGYEALLYDLLNEDLTDFNPRQIPSSNEAFSIKIRSADSPTRYIYEVLLEGGFSVGNDSDSVLPVWQPVIPKQSVYEDYTKWCQRNGEDKISRTIFGRIFKKLLPSAQDKRPGGSNRIRCYEFSSLVNARGEFSKIFKEDPTHIFDSDNT